MGVIERDPTDVNYMALYTAVKWHKEITSDQAIRIVEGRSHAKHGCKLTPEMLEEIKKIIQNPSFKSINCIVRKFRVNKYDLYKALGGKGELANEEVIIVPQIENLLQRLKDRAESCNGNCENCTLNTVMHGENTLCDILCAIEFDRKGNLIPGDNTVVHQKYTKSILKGETKTKSFKLYKMAADKFEQYAADHKDEKIQDIASIALLEYVENRK
jgi:hypothetical protein